MRIPTLSIWDALILLLKMINQTESLLHLTIIRTYFFVR